MYSPTTRLLTILEILQSHKAMSGSELARRLEVDTRTVRRYIVMLQDMGIPVEAERGPYGAYQLQRGYKLPPLMFNDEEAIALTLGLLAIREFHFPVDVAAVEGALAKTERVMPEKLLTQARALRESITFNVHEPPAIAQNEFVTILSTAIQARKQVHLVYTSFGGDETERAFDPYGIVFQEGFWYTSGYCNLRQDLRTFRLDRVVALEPLDTTFERPADFDTLNHVRNAITNISGAPYVEVLLKTSIEHAREVIIPEMGTVEETPEGIIFRRNAYQMEWVAMILVTLDFPVVIRHPPELRGMLERFAARAAEIVSSSI